MKQTKAFYNNVSGSIPYTTDLVAHIYMESSSNTLILYHDNGSPGQDAWLRVPWDTSGASDVNLGYTTQASPYEVLNAGFVSGEAIYIMWILEPGTSNFSVFYSSSPWAASLQRNYCFHDGSIPIFCSTNASSAAIVSSGGTLSLAANGGANWKVQTT